MDLDNFYKENFSSLRNFCYRWTGNIDDASDIAHDSFIELLNQSKKQNLVTNPKAWVYRVAYNRCINHHKFSKRFFRGTNLSEVTNAITYDETSKKTQNQQVRLAMQQLNEKEKALVILYKQGFSYKEMAQVLNMNFTSVGKTLTRAIDKLAKWIEDEYKVT
jgi:RNA polymerase sigma-70 factor (ECF subfamily)